MLDLAAVLASLMKGSRHAALFSFSLFFFFFFFLNCIFGKAGLVVPQFWHSPFGFWLSHFELLAVARITPSRPGPRAPALLAFLYRAAVSNYVLPRCGCASWVSVVRCCCCCCSSSIADRDPLTVQITLAASPTPPPTWLSAPPSPSSLPASPPLHLHLSSWPRSPSTRIAGTLTRCLPSRDTWWTRYAHTHFISPITNL